MICVDCDYPIKEDIKFLMDSENLSTLELSEKIQISRTTLEKIDKTGKAREDICEKFYSYLYENNYRINVVKEELLKEKHPNVLFHGSKKGLSKIYSNGSRKNCDFGKGFYLGETYNQALSFVCEKEKSSIYSFEFEKDDLKIKKFGCDLDWMLTICYYRGTLREFSNKSIVLNTINEVESADVVIAPIADNKMFYIMAQFTDGEINADVALHSLSASKLGLQYIFKTEKALQRLKPVERYYISELERLDCRKKLNERSYEIDTKLKLAKREFRKGLYIEEILK